MYSHYVNEKLTHHDMVFFFIFFEILCEEMERFDEWYSIE
jgi:hypothetical protein